MKTGRIWVVLGASLLAASSVTNAQTATNGPLAPPVIPHRLTDPSEIARRKHADELNQRAKDRRAGRIERARMSTLATLAGMHQGTNFLAKYDLNHDGRLDAHEWMLFRRDLLKLRESMVASGLTNVSAKAP